MKEGGTVRILFAIPCERGGVGTAATSLLVASAMLGHRVELHTPRCGIALPPGVRVVATLPAWTRRLRRLADPLFRRRFFASIRPGDIAHVWPASPTKDYDRLRELGIPVVAESVNTLMIRAKELLDSEYDRLGLAPGHGITAERARTQLDRYDRASAIFTPSPATEAALTGLPYAALAIPSSYGTWVPQHRPFRPDREAGRPVRVLFTGTACVRKGIHKVLEVWRTLPEMIELRIAGAIEPAIAQRFADVLSQPNVSCAGFTGDMAGEYRDADLALLPSLEEGDPLVTYEACAAGLPMIATPIGAGRIGAETGCISVLESGSTDELRDRIVTLAADEERRRAMSDHAWGAVQDYDWLKVADRRHRELQALSARRFAPAPAGARWQVSRAPAGPA